MGSALISREPDAFHRTERARTLPQSGRPCPADLSGCFQPTPGGVALWYLPYVAPAPIDEREEAAAARMSAACEHEANRYGVCVFCGALRPDADAPSQTWEPPARRSRVFETSRPLRAVTRSAQYEGGEAEPVQYDFPRGFVRLRGPDANGGVRCYWCDMHYWPDETQEEQLERQGEVRALDERAAAEIGVDLDCDSCRKGLPKLRAYWRGPEGLRTPQNVFHIFRELGARVPFVVQRTTSASCIYLVTDVQRRGDYGDAYGYPLPPRPPLAGREYPTNQRYGTTGVAGEVENAGSYQWRLVSRELAPSSWKDEWKAACR
jgi:hypothetical protein